MKKIYLVFILGMLLIACQELENNGNKTISTPLQPTPTIEENVFAALDGELLFSCICEPPNSIIYYLDISSGELLQLTQSNSFGSGPQWVPGNDSFVFISQADEKVTMNLMNLDKGEILTLGDDKFSNYHPAISPDGENLVFVSNRDGDEELYLFNYQNQTEVQLTDNEFDDDSPSWSPDGTAIAYISHQNGYRSLNFLDKETKKISTLLVNSPVSNLVWSPDGERLAFGSAQDLTLDIFVVDRDGSNLQQLTDFFKTDDHPVWSPDSNWIAFHSNRDSRYGIYLIEVDTMEMYQFARGDYPIWTPDGQYILFISEDAEFTNNIIVLHIESQEYKVIYESNGIIRYMVLRP